jgi:hypothetical protein
MKFNPNFLAVFAFLLIGLIWSGGHVGWLIALGVYVFLAAMVAPAINKPEPPTRGRRQS